MYETDTHIYLLKKQESETTTFYYTKCAFLAKCPITKKNSDYYLTLANMYANHKLYKCSYEPSDLKKIDLI